ncbi:MAG: aminotransferase class III-fold pyridoxal phosphate-dependent enzyme, partial [Myxococcota bacterium]
GAQGQFGVTPDLTCLGKIVGGGLPAAAYGGRREWMARVAPEGDVYQAGTLSGNPLAMAAGLETLRQLEGRGRFARLEARAERLVKGLCRAAAREGVEFTASHLGGMFGFSFHPGPLRHLGEVRKAHEGRFRSFFGSMLASGIYLAPSAYEAGFVSIAHRVADIDQTLSAAREAFVVAARVR